MFHSLASFFEFKHARGLKYTEHRVRAGGDGAPHAPPRQRLAVATSGARRRALAHWAPRSRMATMRCSAAVLQPQPMVDGMCCTLYDHRPRQFAQRWRRQLSVTSQQLVRLAAPRSRRRRSSRWDWNVADEVEDDARVYAPWRYAPVTVCSVEFELRPTRGVAALCADKIAFDRG